MVDFSDLLILMVVVWTAGKIFRMLNLPVIFGELIGGIIVGPTILGLVPADSEIIHIIAEFGIFFLMLHTGLETDHEKLLKSGKKSILIAILGALTPLLIVYLIAIQFGHDPFTAFFIGTAISISAISITARMFKDYKILNTSVAHLSITAGIINDILGLILFSIALNIAETGAIDWGGLGLLLVGMALFFTVVIYGGSKLSPYMDRIIRFNNKGFTLTLIIALLMGLIAEAIGLHMIIGAFLAGLFIREEVLDERVFKKIEDRIYGLSYSFFAPIFFASLAFDLDFSIFKQMPFFLITILIAGIGGKFLGSFVASRLMKLDPKKSTAIGLAMNNRGALALVIVSVGLKEGIVSPDIFSVLIFILLSSTLFAILAFKPMVKQLKVE